MPNLALALSLHILALTSLRVLHSQELYILILHLLGTWLNAKQTISIQEMQELCKHFLSFHIDEVKKSYLC